MPPLALVLLLTCAATPATRQGVLVLDGGNGIFPNETCVPTETEEFDCVWELGSSAWRCTGIAAVLAAGDTHRHIATQCCGLDEAETCARNPGDGCTAGRDGDGNAGIMRTNYTQAEEVCRQMGLQLCTKSCAGTGCGYNNWPVWTRTPCELPATDQPTDQPTAPTDQPTTLPATTDQPTGTTDQPTDQPTTLPAATDQPTDQPTTLPAATDEPTDQPTPIAAATPDPDSWGSVDKNRRDNSTDAQNVTVQSLMSHSLITVESKKTEVFYVTVSRDIIDALSWNIYGIACVCCCCCCGILCSRGRAHAPARSTHASSSAHSQPRFTVQSQPYGRFTRLQSHAEEGLQELDWPESPVSRAPMHPPRDSHDDLNWRDNLRHVDVPEPAPAPPRGPGQLTTYEVAGNWRSKLRSELHLGAARVTAWYQQEYTQPDGQTGRVDPAAAAKYHRTFVEAELVEGLESEADPPRRRITGTRSVGAADA